MFLILTAIILAWIFMPWWAALIVTLILFPIFH